MTSMSVKALKEQIGGLRIKKEGSTYKYSADDLIVVWGHGNTPPWGQNVGPKKNILNHWSKLPNAISKLRAFKLFKQAGVPTPAWTTSLYEAAEWCHQGHVVLCRTKVSSMEGRGIVVAEREEQLVDAGLYTRYFPTHLEYRVHVFNGEVIDYVQKKLKLGASKQPGYSPYVRNHPNGWIFARQGVTISDRVREVAVQAVRSLGLDFGAVDLAVDKAGHVVVFEVNTAPGLEGTTITKYAEAINKYLQSIQN